MVMNMKSLSHQSPSGQIENELMFFAANKIDLSNNLTP